MQWRRYGLLLGVALLGFLGVRTYFNLTDDFRKGNILQAEVANQKLALSLSSQDHAVVEKALNQKYSYFGKGAQSYAFLSDDGNYVLKLFKSKHYKPNMLESLVGMSDENRTRKEWKKQSTLEGYHLGYHQHKAGSGLLYIHLAPTENLHSTVPLKDKLGREFALDLNHVVFVLQHKGEKLRDVLRKLLSEGNLEEAKSKIRGVFDLYFSEYRKGLYDRDHGVMHNIGYVGGQPFHLDLGKFDHDPRMGEQEIFLKDLAVVIERMMSFFREEYPDLSEEILTTIRDHTHSL